MAFIDLIYPKNCPICLDALPPGKTLICAPCRQKIRYVRGPKCYVCGKPLSDETREYCHDCDRRRPVFTEGIAYAEYSSKYIRRMLVQVKYHNGRQLLDFPCLDFAKREETRIRAWQAEALIPVPVHRSRLKTRGYNQAAEIADRLGRVWKIPVDAEWLVRSGRTEAQKSLNSFERFENLRQAFSLQGPPKHYRNVILVDDIYTTGATVNACAALLKKAGVENIYALYLAIGRDLR